jgi:hypothetical protein
MMNRFVAAIAIAIALLVPARAQFADQATYIPTGAGTANAQTFTLPNASSYADMLGVLVKVIPNVSNTGATTFNFNTFGATALRKMSRSGLVPLTGGEVVAAQPILVMYDGTFFDIMGGGNNAVTACQFGGLKIVNDVGTPNTVMDISFSSATLIVPSSSVGVNLGAASGSLLNLNIANGTVTSAAGGMDGEAVTANGFISIYVIYNGSTVAALGTNSATSTPTMPSGYTYQCFAGAAKVNGSGNFYGFQQIGTEAQYINGGNLLAALPVIVSGLTNANCVTLASPTWATETVRGNSGAAPLWFPPSAVAVDVIADGNYINSTAATVLIAPSTSYGGMPNSGNAQNPSPIVGTTIYAMGYGRMFLQANTIAYCSSGAGGAALASGWKVGGINAN